jgi:hypothetical protein
MSVPVGAGGASEPGISDTRLVWRVLRRLYWWETGGLGVVVHRLEDGPGAVASREERHVCVQGGRKQSFPYYFFAYSADYKSVAYIGL